MTPGRARLWLGAFVVVVFIGGMALGALVGPRLLWRFTGPAAFGRGPGAGGGLGPVRSGQAGARGPAPGFLADRLTRELQLTQEQRARLDQLLAKHREKLDALHADVRGRFDDEQKSMRDDIRQILTPAQQEKLDRFMRLGPPGGGLRGGPPGRRRPPGNGQRGQ